MLSVLRKAFYVCETNILYGRFVNLPCKVCLIGRKIYLFIYISVGNMRHLPAGRLVGVKRRTSRGGCRHGALTVKIQMKRCGRDVPLSNLFSHVSFRRGVVGVKTDKR